jgi:hypothetical protein
VVVGIEGELVKLRVCGEGKVEDFLDEVFGVVVDFEPDSFVGCSVGEIEGVGYFEAAVAHILLFCPVFAGLENGSWGWCPWADNVVASKSREEVALSGHLYRSCAMCLVW